MRLNPIINSLLENDLYKFSMGQAIYHQFNKIRTKWAFKCRNKNVVFTPEMVKEIRDQIEHFCTLRYTEDELLWMQNNIPWLTSDYISHLRRWYPRTEQIHIDDGEITRNEEPCGMRITAEGEWSDTSMYEVPILAIVNEVFFAFKYGVGGLNKKFEERLIKKVDFLNHGLYHLGVFSEFGLRRRYSSDTQDIAVGYLKDMVKVPFSYFVGTSNVYLARKHNVKPVGTMAHEWIQTIGQALHEHNPSYSNYYMMK